MGDGNWLRRGWRSNQKKRKSSDKSKRQKASRRPFAPILSLEPLEDRRVLATYLVNSLGDLDADGNVILGTLRWALNQTNTEDDFDQIVFSDSIFTSLSGEVPAGSTAGIPTISLNGGQLTITQPVAILGPGAFQLNVRQGRAQQRVFETNIGSDDEVFRVEISGMTISGGNLTGTGDDKLGGAVFNRESLTMTEVRLIGNIASTGGGAIYNARGSVTVDRSLIYRNSGGQGGGILNGGGEEDVLPRTTIINSTLAENEAFGAGEDRPAWGGGVFNSRGFLSVSNSTIVGNAALDGEEDKGGGGIASRGNPVPEEEGGTPPAPNVFTDIYSSIVTDNTGNDVQRVGKTEDDPPVELLPSVTSLGYNIVTTGNVAEEGDDFVLSEEGDQPLVDPMLAKDELDNYLFGDFGGSSEVFLLAEMSPALDAGDSSESYDQRGMHFTRAFNEIPDVGAVEMQEGVFFVDTLLDDDDRSFAQIALVTIVSGQPFVTVGSYETPGELSLREAIEFAKKNPGPDTIQFSQVLNTDEVIGREDLNGGVPTITLGIINKAAPSTFKGPVQIDDDLVIVGPSNFVLEVDASGNDPTPGINEGNGSRVFEIDNLDATSLLNVSISNLTIMGADEIGRGGGILSKENLALSHMTVRDNSVTDDGGGLYHVAGSLEIAESTFYNNRASDDGGGLFLDTLAAAEEPTPASILNSTFSGNIAGDRGAGITNQNSALDVKFTTVTLNNSGSTRGSGIVNFGADALTTLQATVVSGNVSNDIEFFLGATGATFVSAGHNYIGRGNANAVFTEPGDQKGANTPMLAPLFNTGGLILTHRPLPGSPLIDAGPDGVTDPTTDQRGGGFERVRDGNLDGTAVADIGAYELQELTLLVDTLADENDGDTSPGGFSLREAIQLANDNPLPDRIEFEPTFLEAIAGMNDPTIGLSDFGLQPGSAPDLRITDSVTIVGPGSAALAIDGSGLAARMAPGPFFFLGSRMFTIDDGAHGSQIDVSISGLTLRGAAAPHAGGAIYSRENLTLDDVTLTNNRTADPDETLAGQMAIDQQGLHGGAVYSQDGVLTILNSLVTGNSTSDTLAHGGAIYVNGGVFNLDATSIAGNVTQVSGDGGGVAVVNATFDLTSSSITGNSTLGGVGDGGGFFASGSVVTIHDGTISDNTTAGANAEGGGFAALSSNVSLVETSVTLNRTTGSQGSGAGIFLGGGTLSAQRTLVAQNVASGLQSWGGGLAMVGGAATFSVSSIEQNLATGVGANGGGVSNVGGTLVIRDSTIHSNRATASDSRGGGVYSDTNLAGAQSTLILNSTVSGNSAVHRGGGVFNADGLLQIQHSTVTNNATPLANVGAGVASQGNTATRTVVRSSIIAGNSSTAPGTADTDVDLVDGTFTNSFVSEGYNVVGPGNAVSAFNGAGDQPNRTDPKLGPLADNGPDDLFFLLQTHLVLEGSPAINAGSPSFNPNDFSPALTTDQRGGTNLRVRQGRIDAGSVESNFGPTPPADFTGDAAVDGNDFLAWQMNVGRTNATKQQGDANGDAVVNGMDLAVWRGSYGAGVTPAAEAAVAASSSAALVAADEGPAAAARPAYRPNVFVAAPSESPLASDAVDLGMLAEADAHRQTGVADEGFAALVAGPIDGWLRYAASDAFDAYQQGEDAAEATPEDAAFAALGAALRSAV